MIMGLAAATPIPPHKKTTGLSETFRLNMVTGARISTSEPIGKLFSSVLKGDFRIRIVSIR